MEEVTVVDVKPQLIAGISKRGHYREIAELLTKLYEHARKKGATFTAHPTFLCHETADEIKCYTPLGGKMAKIIHKDPYDKCEPTYNKTFAWIKKNEKTNAGPTREIYLNDPREVSLEEALTEIYIPSK